MEQMLDLPVQSAPLKHVTKTRIRNNSRKILLPSKNHLKRNLIGESIYLQPNHISPVERDMNTSAFPASDGVKLKLPPPPVAKKPKISIPSSSARKSSNDIAKLHNGEEVVENRQKPVIAPNPNILRSTSSTSKEMNNNYRDTELGFSLNIEDNKELFGDVPERDLNSSTKTHMSFSERLRASSLSRRKEGNTSDGSQVRFRSQIISPIRRGSRSFLTPDSPLDNDTKPKSREFLFKRFSSETSLMLKETKENDSKKEDFDLEKFKDLRLETVDPVIVDSILSTNNSFEEDDVVKDSFDSGELFKAEKTISEPSNKESTYFQSVPSTDTPLDKLDLGENLVSSEPETREQERLVFVDKTALDEAAFVERDEGSTLFLDMHDHKKQTLSYRDMRSSIASQAKSLDDKANETILNVVDSKQLKSSQNLRSPRKFGRSKGGNNVRKKFTPVGMEETTSLTDGRSKTESEFVEFEDRKSSDFNVLDSVDTESSFEYVTPDIELDSTFELPLNMNNQVPFKSAREVNGKLKLNENEELMFLPDSSSSPPLVVPEYDESNGLKWDVSPPKTGTSNIDNMDSELFLRSADPPDYVMQDADALNIKDDEFSLETVPSLDVEMLPFVPPPPMDEDAFVNDEDMAFSIIDPPTIYGDDDEDVEFTSNIDFLPVTNGAERHDDLLSRRNENMEEECENRKGENRKSSFENDWPKNSEELVFSQSDKKHSVMNGGEVHDAVVPHGDKNLVNCNKISRESVGRDVSSVGKSNVLSMAKRFDAATGDNKENYKPPVPAKPANLNKKLSIVQNKINNPEISKTKSLTPPIAQDKSNVSSKNVLNGSHSAIEISEKGQERRRSFSDRVAAGVDGYNTHESFSDGMYEEYLQETDAKIEPLLLMSDKSSTLMKSWLEQPGKEPSEPNVLNILEKSKTLPTSGLSEEEIISKVIVPNESSGDCDEILPVHDESLSRKCSLGDARSAKSSEELETKKDAKSRWSSFSSTSSDEKIGEKKVNIAKLLRERTQSDVNIDNDEDFVVPGLPNVDGVWRSNDAPDTKGDDEDEGKYVDDLGDVLLQDDSRFESTPLDEWTVEDVGDWLEMIGLADLRSTFEEKCVDGRQLQAIDLQLLDEIGITDVDDRELILSEIYALKNPEDFDIEMSLLDALDNASGYDREKMLAVLEALKMSSEDQENRYLPSSTPPQLSSGVKKAASQNSKKSKGDYRRAMSEHKSSSGKPERDEERSKSASPVKGSHDIWDQGGGDSERANDGSKKTSMKKRSFLKEAFSFRRKRSGKLAKLFSSRKKLVDSSLKYLLQTTPQGVIKIWTTHVNEVEADNVSLLVTSTTTSLEVTKTVLEKLELAVDVNCFYVAQSHSTKSVPEIILKDDDCPLVFQCRWPDAERYRFELKKHSEGSVIIAFSEEENDERSVKIDTTMRTKCSEIIAIALKKLQKNEQVNSFSLYKMKNMNKQGHSNVTEENSQIPMDARLLKLAPSTMQPAVYKLVRVNFLGSPEKSLKPEQSRTIKKLENELREKEKQLMRSYELNSSIEAKLQEIKQQNEFLKQKFKDKDEDVARLENIADSLRLELDQRNDGLSNVIESSDENQKEKLVKKLSRQEMKTKSLEEWIQNLEKTLQQKEEEVRRLQDCQVKIGSYKNKEINERSMKLKEMEEEMIKLKSRIVEVENSSLEAKIQFREREDELSEENQALKSEVEQLRMGALRSDSEEEKQEQNKKYDDKIEHLQEELNRKQKMLDEMEIVSQDLKNKIISLERSIKQKDKLISDTSAAQADINELRREIEVSSKEVSVKMKEAEDARQRNRELVERFKYDMKEKDHELEKARTELSEIRKQNHEMDEERKILKSRLRDLELTSRGKEQKLEELSDVHQEYKEQIQKMKKLERELSLRSDEIEKLNIEKDESLEDLRNHAESLEQKLIERDAKILDLEFRMEKAERDLREAENLVDDEVRDKNRLSIAIDDGVRKVKELTTTIDDYRQLVAEKDKTIQVLKDSQSDANEGIRRELSTAKRILNEKERTIEQIRKTFDEERMEMKSHFETLQELINAKETKWREKESRLVEEKEAQRALCAQMEEKLKEKDATVRKLEAKISKLEKMARDNMKKFEKFMSDKDRMLKQVKEESQKDIAELKSKIRQMDDNLTAKEKHVMQLNRSGSIKNEYEIKLRQKEEENKQHKFLLERLMSVANSRDPGILEEFESSFGQTSKPRDDKRPLLSKPDDDWC